MTTLIELKGIAAVIEGRRLAVPIHQRPFEWTATEVGELLSDIEQSLARGSEEYFLGSVVVAARPGADRHEVLDGQQRLATVCLLLAALGDAFEARSEGDAAQAIRHMVSSYDIDTSSHSNHLRLNADDDPFFSQLLRPKYEPPAEGAPESHTRLHDARRAIGAWLGKKLASEHAALAWLRNLAKYLRDSVRVIYFGVPDDANAFLIFETLNDRGLDLSIADLLKNYLLGRSGKDLQSVLTLWNRTLATLEAYGGEGSFKVFLRHYWSSRYEVVREKELYRAVKARVNVAANVLDFATELATSSHHYAALLSAEHEYWAGASLETRERLRTLGVLGLEQYRPMLLAALAHFKLREVEQILHLLENWNVRLVIVGGLGGGVMEGNYAELGWAIRAGDVKTVPELAARAKAFVPSDVEFREAFATASVSKVQMARYLLATLELQGSRKKDAEKVASPLLTLEHILPEKPGDNWPQFSTEERRLYTRRIGNLALLTQRMNSDARSARFETKKATYRKSELRLTRALADFEAWTVASIDERQETLARLAVKAWPLKVK